MEKRWVLLALGILVLVLPLIKITGFAVKDCSATLYYIGMVDRELYNFSYNPENRNQKLFTLNGLDVYPGGCKEGTAIRVVRGLDEVRLESNGSVLDIKVNNEELGNSTDMGGILIEKVNGSLALSVPEETVSASIKVNIGESNKSFTLNSTESVKTILDFKDFEELKDGTAEGNGTNYTYTEKVIAYIPAEGETSVKAGGFSYIFQMRDRIVYSTIGSDNTLGIPFMGVSHSLMEVDLEKSTAYLKQGDKVYIAKGGLEYQPGWKWSVAVQPMLQLGIKNSEAFDLDGTCIQMPNTFAEMCHEAQKINYSEAKLTAEMYEGMAAVKADGDIAVGEKRALTAYAAYTTAEEAEVSEEVLQAVPEQEMAEETAAEEVPMEVEVEKPKIGWGELLDKASLGLKIALGVLALSALIGFVANRRRKG